MRWDNVYLDGLLLLVVLTVVTGVAIWWDVRNRPAPRRTGSLAAGEFWGRCERHAHEVRPVVWQRLTPLEAPSLLCRACIRDFALEPGHPGGR